MSEESGKPMSPPSSVTEDESLSKSFSGQVAIEEDSEVFEDAREDGEEYEVESRASDSAVSDFEGGDIGTAMPPAPSFKVILLQFLKEIATSGADLYGMSSPAIMCNGISVLEYCAHYCDHPEILAAISKGESPVDRMLAVVQWFISGLFGSYASRSTTSGFERKPFNPILGEQFFASWPNEGYGETEMFAEQVSHHPPTTAFYLRNKTAGVHVNAFSTQKTRFMGTSIKAEQHGSLFLYLEKHKEEYMLSFPEIYVRGLLTGAPFIELCGDVAIVSSAGFGVKMRFIPKPWFSGEYDQVEAVIFDTKTGRIHFDIWGKWSGTVYFSEHEEESPKRCHFRKRKPAASSSYYWDTNSSESTSTSSQSSSMSGTSTGEPYGCLVANHTRTGPVLFSSEMMPKVPFTVRPISQQGTLESRRVWHPVTKALMKSDYSAAQAAKNRIEEEQRALRKGRVVSKETWTPNFFEYRNICFMANVMKDDGHLEEILDNLISDSPKMLVAHIDEDSAAVATGTNSPSIGSSSTSSSSNALKSFNKYKGRWVFSEFGKSFLKQIEE